MSDLACGILGFAILMILLGLRVPVGFSFFISGILGFAFLGKLGAGLKCISFVSWTYSTYFILACIPLFTLMGHFVHESGVSSQMFDSVYKWMGKLKGGVALTTLGTCVLFAACSGSSLAAVSTIGVIAYSEMDKYGYDKRLSLGSISVGGTLAVLIPPSAVMILYAVNSANRCRPQVSPWV